MTIGSTQGRHDWLVAWEHGEETWLKIEAKLKAFLIQKIQVLDSIELRQRINDQGFWAWLWARITHAARQGWDMMVSLADALLDRFLDDPINAASAA